MAVDRARAQVIFCDLFYHAKTEGRYAAKLVRCVKAGAEGESIEELEFGSFLCLLRISSLRNWIGVELRLLEYIMRNSVIGEFLLLCAPCGKVNDLAS